MSVWKRTLSLFFSCPQYFSSLYCTWFFSVSKLWDVYRHLICPSASAAEQNLIGRSPVIRYTFTRLLCVPGVLVYCVAISMLYIFTYIHWSYKASCMDCSAAFQYFKIFNTSIMSPYYRKGLTIIILTVRQTQTSGNLQPAALDGIIKHHQDSVLVIYLFIYSFSQGCLTTLCL